MRVDDGVRAVMDAMRDADGFLASLNRVATRVEGSRARPWARERWLGAFRASRARVGDSRARATLGAVIGTR